ncbi:unnamed protein product [Anisakis simplex]|uniref:Pecanex-like protein n=1 Tax=Anisakis simplex TaxID=6269 RepID=A0A0M3JHR2_ANISI|nr:unnamed protein product [Anisakis simplex]
MSTRRSRRKSGAASAGDDPCGSEAAAALTDSSSNTSPVCSQRLESAVLCINRSSEHFSYRYGSIHKGTPLESFDLS